MDIDHTIYNGSVCYLICSLLLLIHLSELSWALDYWINIQLNINLCYILHPRVSEILLPQESLLRGQGSIDHS